MDLGGKVNFLGSFFRLISPVYFLISVNVSITSKINASFHSFFLKERVIKSAI